MTTANILSQLGSPGVSTGFKNRIINGACVINQRVVSSTTTNGTFPVDRWYFGVSTAGTLTAQQSTGVPAGFVKSIAFTKTTGNAPAAGEFNYFTQAIEGYNIGDLGWGTANAKAITLSFWAYSGATGTFSGSLRNNGSGGFRAYPFTYVISSANTWTYCSITIPGDTSGSWSTDAAAGVYVFFDLGSGTSARAAAGSWAVGNYIGATGSSTYPTSTSGGSMTFTGFQFEVGTTATNFDYRPYGTELSLCQRYFYSIINTATRLCIGFIPSSNNAYGITTLPVPMRVAPTISYSGSFYGVDASATGRGMTAGTDGTTPTIVTYYFTAGFNLNAGNATMLGLSSSGYVWASSEI